MDRQTDKWTDLLMGDGQQAIRKAHLSFQHSSGELKTTMMYIFIYLNYSRSIVLNIYMYLHFRGPCEKYEFTNTLF